MLEENYDFHLIDTNFPHIGKKISFLWGHTEFNDMIVNLMDDTRDGQRSGFPIEFAGALLRLSMLHDKEFPEFVETDNGIWYLIKKR